MTSDGKIMNQRAMLKGSGSAGPITSGCSESERDNDSRAARKIADR